MPTVHSNAPLPERADGTHRAVARAVRQRARARTAQRATEIRAARLTASLLGDVSALDDLDPDETLALIVAWQLAGALRPRATDLVTTLRIDQRLPVSTPLKSLDQPVHT